MHAHPIVTLHGIGGTGKTTLAGALAERLGGRFPDGVFAIPLATVRDPDAVPTGLVKALGAAPPAGTAVLDHLLEVLAPRKALLVLDGFEHLREARTVVAALHDLARGYEADGDLASAEFHARRLLALDALHDAANATLMRVVSGQGRRTEALRHFH